ncbi:MAG TPA: response regulator [Anaerolineaceae bacterium]|nr:response regulator [Anaerolineaceae bacterium]
MPDQNKTPYVWRILLIDDDEDDFFLTRELLASARQGKFILEWEASYSAGKEALHANEYDAVLVDYDLGIQTGTQLIREMIAEGYRVPFLLMTGRGSYEVDLEAMDAGALDYLPKSEVNAALLERSIRYAIERKRVEEELHSSNEALDQERLRLKTLIENAPSGILLTDREGNFIITNPTIEGLFSSGLTPNAFSPDEGYTLQYPDGRPIEIEDQPLAQALKKGLRLQNFEMLIHQAIGPDTHLLCNTSPIYDAHGVITGSVAVLSDITELRELEQQQLENQAKMEVQRRLMQYREMERMEIARDLHDGPIQELLAININLAENIQMENHAENRGKFQWVRDQLQEQIGELRLFCHELRPPTLAPFGLEKAIRSHITTFCERYPDLNVQLDLEPDGRILSEDTRMAVFRIYQELLNNVIKHAQAKELFIHLAVLPDRVTLEVQDDGVGFEVPNNWIAQARSGHLGLIGMRERAEAVGGLIEFDSEPGQGTLTRVTVFRPNTEVNLPSGMNQTEA